MNCNNYKVDEDGNYLCGGFWGGGYGFHTFTAWSHDYEIGCLVFTNSQFHNQNEVMGLNIIHSLIDERLVEKNKSLDNPPWEMDWDYENNISPPQTSKADTFTPTPYQPTWSKYTGTYRYIMSGYKFDLYGSIAAASGNWGSPDVEVCEKNGYLEIDGRRLDEHLPGLFFTDDGECLDLRGSTPTWQNYRMKKIR